MWKRLIWSFFAGVIFVFTGAVIYWELESVLEFEAPTVKMITQIRGSPVAIDVVTDHYLSAGKFTLQIIIATDRGVEIKKINAAQIVVGKKYYVLTGADLPVGTYEIYAVVRYTLNPLRDITEYFIIALLKVEDTESGT